MNAQPRHRTLIPAILGLFTLPLLAATYHIDAAKGADGQSGLAPDAAWKTLEKVNTTTFAPGDRILFAAGSRWQGKLNPKGSGALCGFEVPALLQGEDISLIRDNPQCDRAACRFHSWRGRFLQAGGLRILSSCRFSLPPRAFATAGRAADPVAGR